MRTWLITGGAGFIGANFVHKLFDLTDVKIVIVDKLTYAGDLRRLDGVLGSDRVVFKHSCITNQEAMSQVFHEHKVQKVVHFAAESHVDRSILGPEVFLKSNVEGTVNLLRQAQKHWDGNFLDKMFIHISTDEVYGDLGPEDKPFTEFHPYKPSSPYSASKAASDHFVRSWHRTYGLPIVITNCSNNYGPWQFPEKLIPLMIQNAFDQKPLPVYGDGTQIRDWIHVEEHCEAILTVSEYGKVGETYLIGANEEMSNLKIVKTICELVDQARQREPGETAKLITYVKDRPGHDHRYAINNSKIRDDLGWAPKRNFESSLAELVTWMEENQNWLKSVRDQEYLYYYQNQYGINLQIADQEDPERTEK
jgi:dTDP-glucose 4,6-dehydratase